MNINAQTLDMYAAYAAGTLDEAASLVFACHAALNEQSADIISTYEHAAGALLDEEQPIQVSSSCLEKTLSAIRTTKNAKQSSAAFSENTLFPSPLQEKLADYGHALPWKTYGNILKRFTVFDNKDNNISCQVIAVKGGTKLPHHTHGDHELVLVLQGSLRDERGTFRRGDLAIADSTVSHRPETLPGEECICLVATAGRVKYKGLMSPILNLIAR